MLELEVVQEAFPEYTVDRLIGQGTFKAAYSIIQPEPLALKIILENIEDENAEPNNLPERLSREIIAMQNLDCPRIVKIHQAPELRRIGQNEYFWYLEPFYSGPTVADAIRKGDYGPELGTKLLTELISALSALEGDGIVHRDIKPGNIVLDDNDLPVLLDLGIALFTALSPLTSTNQMSPATTMYAAPEQFELRRSTVIDQRTDMYQLALVVFEATTGYHRFFRPGISTPEYLDGMFSHRASETNSLLLECGMHPGMASIVSRCLSPQLSKRFRNTKAMQKFLEGAL